MPIVVGRVAHPGAALRGCHIGIRHEIGSICMRMVVVAVVVQESSGKEAVWTRSGYVCRRDKDAIAKRGE